MKDGVKLEETTAEKLNELVQTHSESALLDDDDANWVVRREGEGLTRR